MNKNQIIIANKCNSLLHKMEAEFPRIIKVEIKWP